MPKQLMAISAKTQQDMVPMLLPLVRLFLRAGLGAGEFALASKLAFIRIAAENAFLAERLNVSAIAASTGLTRKEVRALLDSLDKEGSVAQPENAHQRTRRVLQGWLTDMAYRDRHGVPKSLPMRGDEASFEALVKRFGGDVTPMSVLRELQRTGSVVRTRAGLIKLKKYSTQERGYGADVLGQVALHVADLASALVKNIEQPDRPIFVGFEELKAVPEDVAQLFNALFSERAGLLLEGVSRWVNTHYGLAKRPKAGMDRMRRVGLGIYFIDEPAGQDKATLPAPSLQRKRLGQRRARLPKTKADST